MKTQLMDMVIKQMKDDFQCGDESAFYELLDNLHEDDLFNFLSIEKQNFYRLIAGK